MCSAMAAGEASATALDFAWPDLTECRESHALCRLADGREFLAREWTTLDSRRGRRQLQVECGPVLVGLEVSRQNGRLLLRLTARASQDCQVAELGLRTTPRIKGGPPARVLWSGYQSWDTSGDRALGAEQPQLTEPVESWWSIGLADGAGRGLAAVAVAATRASFRSSYDGERWELLWCEPPANGSSRPLWVARAGERFDADAISLGADTEVSSALAHGAQARTWKRAGEVPQGWLSWYQYGPWVAQDDVLENSQRLRAPDMDGLGYRVIQVDDGWQRAYGDWTPNAKFPDGFAVLAERLGRAGQTLGVWTAPFLAAEDSEFASTAPSDWFLTDQASGQRLVDERHVLMGPMNVLDLRRTPVRRHLRTTFARLRAEGIGYFKIDFLYAGGYAGTRALRAGIRAIREGAGDAYLLACGAPLLPMAGLVDGCRVGPDTATPFYDFGLGASQPTVFGDEVVAVARDLAARLHLAPWFQLDADVALVGGNLSLEQGRQLVTLAALSGGPFFVSDNLGGLPPERLALLTNPEVIRLVGGGWAVPDWDTGQQDLPPTTWRRGDVVAVFNWSAESREVDVAVPGECSVRDIWAARELGIWGGRGRVRVEPGSVCLLRISG
jgi:hypothetical protein